ncbi:hypothetical protein [Paraburkholderia oxyphila]|uniref:hypothetical protein n=1 Tax=Paraburkholderia oxyphila TaxID=614212 RepID=UPI0012ECF304|nr:hypothetical protein [Paraburkholderia oxyphila]
MASSDQFAVTGYSQFQTPLFGDASFAGAWLTCGSGHLLALQLDDRELVGYERDDLYREVARSFGPFRAKRGRCGPSSANA